MQPPIPFLRDRMKTGCSSPRVMPSKAKSPLGVIFLTIFVSMVGFGIVIPVLPVYAKNAPFQMNPAQLGWLTGIFSLVQLFSAPLIGRISDRIGRKPVLLVSVIGTAVGYFITGFANAAWMLFLGRIIDGASGGNIATAQACIADVTKPEERSKAMGVIGAAFGLGFMMGPAIGGILGHIRPDLPFHFAGALSLLNAVLVIANLPETLSAEKRAHPTHKLPLSEAFSGGRGPFISLLLAAALISTTGFAFIHVLFALFCGDHFGWTVKQTGYAFAYIGFLAVLVQGGLLRRLLKPGMDGARTIEKTITVVGCAVLALGLWMLPRIAGGDQGFWPFLGICALIALGNGLATPTLTGMASRHVHGRAQGRVLGLMAAAGSFGRFLGPALAVLPLPANFSELARPLDPAAQAVISHGYQTAFSGSAALIAVATVCALLLPVPKEDLVEAEPAPLV
jgi:multidrug resistance protein